MPAAGWPASVSRGAVGCSVLRRRAAERARAVVSETSTSRSGLASAERFERHVQYGQTDRDVCMT